MHGATVCMSMARLCLQPTPVCTHAGVVDCLEDFWCLTPVSLALAAAGCFFKLHEAALRRLGCQVCMRNVL